MSKDSLQDRGRALEDAFFAAQSEQKIAKLRASLEAEEALQGIAEQTGISDAALVKRVVELGVRPATLAAFALVPLIHVAWSDGTIDPPERKAILVEALALGMKEDSPAMDLLTSWLDRRPSPVLFEAWKAWHAEVIAGLDETGRLVLADRLMENARRVARASGGLLGIGAVNASERTALDDLAEVLAPATV